MTLEGFYNANVEFYNEPESMMQEVLQIEQVQMRIFTWLRGCNFKMQADDQTYCHKMNIFIKKIFASFFKSVSKIQWSSQIYNMCNSNTC